VPPNAGDSAATTYFAPAERATEEDLRTARDQFLSDRIAPTVLEGVPDPVIVLNRERQIVACNSSFLGIAGKADAEELLGARPGEAAYCLYRGDGPGGCGTGQRCVECGAVNAVVACLESGRPVTRECRLQTTAEADGGALDVVVRASIVTIRDRDFVVVALRDISGEKRRQVLERVFFHDVLNTATGIYSLAWLLNDTEQDAEQEAEAKQDLLHLSQQISDEIAAQRQLLAAERGELKLKVADVSVSEVLDKVIAAYRRHNVARGRELQLGPAPTVSIETDATVLQRVIGNLVKNALEATPEGEAARVWAEEHPGEIIFRVANPAVMPESVQRQIFQRSFTTKGGEGRGIGTHSVKLFTERYLGGEVDFTSMEPDGTVFSVTLPRP
jgi:signal transduction histidine kinase